MRGRVDVGDDRGRFFRGTRIHFANCVNRVTLRELRPCRVLLGVLTQTATSVPSFSCPSTAYILCSVVYGGTVRRPTYRKIGLAPTKQDYICHSAVGEIKSEIGI